MKPGIVKVNAFRKGEGFRMFNEFREVKNKDGFSRVEVRVGSRRYELRPEAIRRWPDADS